jgi:hypothetical protein
LIISFILAGPVLHAVVAPGVERDGSGMGPLSGGWRPCSLTPALSRRERVFSPGSGERRKVERAVALHHGKRLQKAGKFA